MSLATNLQNLLSFDPLSLVGRGHSPRAKAPNTGAGVWERRRLMSEAGLSITQHWRDNGQRGESSRAWVHPAALALTNSELETLARWRAKQTALRRRLATANSLTLALKQRSPDYARHERNKALGRYLSSLGLNSYERADIYHRLDRGEVIADMRSAALAVKAANVEVAPDGKAYLVEPYHQHYAKSRYSTQLACAYESSNRQFKVLRDAENYADVCERTHHLGKRGGVRISEVAIS